MGSVVFSIIQRYLPHKKILLISSLGFIFSIFVSTCIYNIEYFIYILISLIFMGLFGDLLYYVILPWLFVKKLFLLIKELCLAVL